MSSPHSRAGRRLRMLATGAVCLGSSLAVAACSVGGGSEAATDSSTLRIVLPQEPPTLEACESTLTSTGVVVRSNITEPLVEREPTSGELEPRLATKWEQTDDNTWTFTLRDGVKFTDGEPFDAEAAKFTIERSVNSDLGCNVDGYVFGDDDLTVTAVDPTTLTVETVTPDPILPLRLSFVEMVSPKTDSAKKVREPIGTGPYKVAKWNAGQNLQLDRNADYWGEKPAYEKAEYQWRTEGTVRAAMLTNNETDLALGLGPDDGAGDLGVSYPNNETTALRFNGNDAPLDDIRVRQAINYAIDKDKIVSSLFKDLGKPAGQLVPPGVVGHNDALKPWPYDLAKAKSLVAEAKADGVPVDTEIKLIARNAQFPKVSETAEVLQNSMSQAGLKVKLEMVDTTAHLEYQLRPFVKDAGPVALLVMHGNQAGDAQFTVDQYMGSTGEQSIFGTPALDKLLKESGVKFGEARQKAYADLLAYQNDEVTQFATIAHMSGVMGISESVSYKPNSASADELQLSEVTPAK